MSATEARVDVSRVRQTRLDELRPWDENPRTISKERFKALCESLTSDPEMLYARPLVALPDGRVIFGNQRLAAARELGWKSIPAVVVDLPEEQALTWALRDNNSYGEWDDKQLAVLLSAYDGRVNTLLTGFASDALAHLAKLAQEPPPDTRGTKLELADVTIGDPNHVVADGDLWALGHHVLAVTGVYDGWATWAPLLTEGALFVPYPTPTVPLTMLAQQTRLVMVQPDVWLSGHVLDKYAAVHGEDAVSPYVQP